MESKPRLFLFLIAIPLLGMGAPKCATTPDPTDIKVYYSRPDLGGAYRGQDEELIPFADTVGYRMVNQEHWFKLLQKCTTPEGE